MADMLREIEQAILEGKARLRQLEAARDSLKSVQALLGQRPRGRAAASVLVSPEQAALAPADTEMEIKPGRGKTVTDETQQLVAAGERILSKHGIGGKMRGADLKKELEAEGFNVGLSSNFATKFARSQKVRQIPHYGWEWLGGGDED